MMTLRTFIGLCTAVALTACGGGGGSAGSAPFGPGSGTVGGGTASPTITVSVAPTTVTAATPGVVTATVKSAAGAGIAGQVVQFATSQSLGKLSPSSALTDSNGVATVSVSPATASSAGADTVVATTTVGGTTLTASTGFQLTATNIAIAGFTSDLTTPALSPYGQTTLTVTLSAGAAGNPATISITSTCLTKNLATLTPTSVTTTTGTATFTYRDNGCGADLRDNLQASLAGTTSTAQLQLTLTAPSVASISFTSASPENIYLRGSGLVENSTVTFTVKDAAGNGVRGQTVSLEPTTLAGGLKVDDLSSGFPLSKTTDANGNVLVRVNSGTVPTPVRIRASIVVNGVPVSTVSSELSVAVGLPTQRAFSLSQGASNIEGFDRDGTSNTYQIIASDRLGNPVPDGTSINFISEGGQIQAIAQTVTGADKLSRAVANFQTARPVPPDGRITILAYALGEKSFLDTNGDNVFTTGELFGDLGDPYLDTLFNGIFDSASNQYIEQLPAGTLACVTSTAPQLRFDRGTPIRPNTCNQQWGRAYVRAATETILSTSSARISWGTSLPSGSAVQSTSVCPTGQSLIVPNNFPLSPSYDSNGNPSRATYFAVGSTSIYSLPVSGVLAFYVSDANPVAFNPVAAGSTVSVSATSGLVVGIAGGTPVPSTSTPPVAGVSFKFDTASEGVISITVRSPSGLATTTSQFVSALSRPAGYQACP